ncbi:MAG: hypothetical protein WDA02_05890 [Saccharofermentanales bacterium]
MSKYSKRLNIHPNILIEYIFEDSPSLLREYKVLTNIKENTKSFISDNGNNTIDNNLFSIDPILNKFSIVDTENFNFLKIQDYSTTIKYDKIKIYFSSGFNFYDYLGFYINIYTQGYNNNTKYSLSNFYYLKSNTNSIDIFDLNIPFYYNEKFWVRYIELEIPSINIESSNRIVTNSMDVPTNDTLNQFLTYGEGLSTNSPIFIDFSFITHTESIFNIPYYFTGDEYNTSLPQSPEYTSVGINIVESEIGDFFEIYSTYMGSNEYMDTFAYNEMVKGDKIRLDYIINLYEENILTNSETRTVYDDFSKKILYRPVIQFSNTTAMIEVELRIISLVDNGYISKFGTLGIFNNINKYGLKLSKLDISKNTINPNIYNLKVDNNMTGGGINDGIIDVMKVPYPVLIDKYKILTKSDKTLNDRGYSPNGILEILINPFDNIIEFNIAQDINSDGNVVPYDISNITINSNLILVFKSDSEKLELEPYYQANNNYENGIIYYRISENNYNVIRRIYDKGYDNFYLVVSSDSSKTQLYSGKFALYEDITFISEESDTGTTNITTSDVITTSTDNSDNVIDTVDSDIVLNNDFITEKIVMSDNSDKNYFNLIVYVRFQQNIDSMKSYCDVNGLKPKINYGNLFYFEKVYINRVEDLKKQIFIEKVFQLEIGKPNIIEKEIIPRPIVSVTREPEISPLVPNDITTRDKKIIGIPPKVTIDTNNRDTDITTSVTNNIDDVTKSTRVDRNNIKKMPPPSHKF